MTMRRKEWKLTRAKMNGERILEKERLLWKGWDWWTEDLEFPHFVCSFCTILFLLSWMQPAENELDHFHQNMNEGRMEGAQRRIIEWVTVERRESSFSLKIRISSNEQYSSSSIVQNIFHLVVILTPLFVCLDGISVILKLQFEKNSEMFRTTSEWNYHYFHLNWKDNLWHITLDRRWNFNLKGTPNISDDTRDDTLQSLVISGKKEKEELWSDSIKIWFWHESRIELRWLTRIEHIFLFWFAIRASNLKGWVVWNDVIIPPQMVSSKSNKIFNLIQSRVEMESILNVHWSFDSSWFNFIEVFSSTQFSKPCISPSIPNIPNRNR